MRPYATGVCGVNLLAYAGLCSRTLNAIKLRRLALLSCEVQDYKITRRKNILLHLLEVQASLDLLSCEVQCYKNI
jgi:hypothetical protein